MTDTPEPSPEAAPPTPIPRILAANPLDRVVPLLSAEVPPRRRRTRARTLSLVRKLCAAVVAAIIVVLALASVLDETEPGQASSRAVSVR
jgi:hypothetical protein